MADKRVLVVDDTMPNLQLLGNILKDKYSLSFASSGQEALDMLGKSTPDLILLDIMMPGIDGFEVCRRVRMNPATKFIPIVFLSAKNDRESVIKGMGLGAQDYLIKPFSAEEVLTRIQSLLFAMSPDAGSAKGRAESKTSWIFLKNRIENFSVCFQDKEMEISNQIQAIEMDLDPLVSVIPVLVKYLHSLEGITASKNISQQKDLKKQLEKIQQDRQNPEIISAVHSLHDNLQDIQFKLIDLMASLAPAMADDSKEEKLSLKSLYQDLKEVLPDGIELQWKITGIINSLHDFRPLRQVILALVDNALDEGQRRFGPSFLLPLL